MPFTDNFLNKDKPLALQYRAEINKYFDLSMACLDKGKFKKSEMHFNHFLSLRRELIRMRNEKLVVENNEYSLSDRGMRVRRDYF